jgi:hypothetical protein
MVTGYARRESVERGVEWVNPVRVKLDKLATNLKPKSHRLGA